MKTAHFDFIIPVLIAFCILCWGLHSCSTVKDIHLMQHGCWQEGDQTECGTAIHRIDSGYIMKTDYTGWNMKINKQRITWN